MKALLEMLDKGGPAMIAIIALSVVLYSRCFKLLLSLHRTRRRVAETRAVLATQREAARRLRDELQDSFQHQRVALGAMIAAAPLLGLLGTVSGMVTTFESLAGGPGEKSMDGLAGGISEVLIATESGLLVALPALGFVYLAHRAVAQQERQLSEIEQAGSPPSLPS